MLMHMMRCLLPLAYNVATNKASAGMQLLVQLLVKLVSLSLSLFSPLNFCVSDTIFFLGVHDGSRAAAACAQRSYYEGLF